MVSRPPTKWNTAQRMLLVKERIEAPGDQQRRYTPLVTGQPQYATEQFVSRVGQTPEVRDVPVMVGHEGMSGQQGEETMRHRPFGAQFRESGIRTRPVQQDERVRSIDQRRFYSPMRAVQAFRESPRVARFLGRGRMGQLGRNVDVKDTDPETGVGRQVVDLPDESGPERRMKLQDAFRNQQKFLERLSREGKRIPAGFGEFSGQHPSVLLSRLQEDNQARLFIGNQGESMDVDRPLLGAGGLLERLSAKYGRDRAYRFRTNPIETALGGFAGLIPGTTEYNRVKAAQAEVDHNTKLLQLVQRRKAINPDYMPDEATQRQLSAFQRNLVDAEGEGAMAFLNSLARDPAMQEINERVKRQKADKVREEGLARKRRELEERMNNPRSLKSLPEINNYLADLDPNGPYNFLRRFRSSASQKRNRGEIMGEWQEIMDALSDGASPQEIQRQFPDSFTGLKKVKDKKKVADKKDEAEDVVDDDSDEAEEDATVAEDKDTENPYDEISHLYTTSEHNNQPYVGSLRDALKVKGLDPFKTVDGKRMSKKQMQDLLLASHREEDLPEWYGGEDEGVDGEGGSGEKPTLEERQASFDAKKKEEANAKAAAAKKKAEAEAKAAKKVAQSEHDDRTISSGLFNQGTKTKNAPSKNQAAEFSAFMQDTDGIAAVKRSKSKSFGINLGGKITLPVSAYRGLAKTKPVNSAAPRTKPKNQELEDVLSAQGLWDEKILGGPALSQIRDGTDIEHWGPIYSYLTGGGDLNEFGQTDDVLDDSLLYSDDEPIDLAWAVLKGL